MKEQPIRGERTLYGTLVLLEYTHGRTNLEGRPRPKAGVQTLLKKVQLWPIDGRDAHWFAQARADLQLLIKQETTFQDTANPQPVNRYANGTTVGEGTLCLHWENHQRPARGGGVYWRLPCILISIRLGSNAHRSSHDHQANTQRRKWPSGLPKVYVNTFFKGKYLPLMYVIK